MLNHIRNSLSKLLRDHDLFYLYLRTLRCALTDGPKEAKRRYIEYINVNHPHSYQGYRLSSQERQAEIKQAGSYDTVISIIVPLYNTPKDYLRGMIRSVLHQTYGNWELCLADGSDPRHAYIERICRRMARKDKRIRYQRLRENLGISGNSNACLLAATGEYIGLLDHDDFLHPSALYEVIKVASTENADFIYTDEAIFRKKLKDVNRFNYKPDFSPDLLRSMNYICHFTVFDRKLLEQAGGGFRSEYDGSQDYDLVLRLTEKAKHIVHIRKELYYWREHAGSVASNVSVKPYTIESGKKALSAHLARMQLSGEVKEAAFPSTYRIQYQIIGKPVVSIIIPNMDHVEDLRNCIASIREKTTWQEWEIIVVENNSTKEETFQYYREIEKEDPRIRVAEWSGEFNFSAICNYGATFARGDYLLLMNNDMEVITPTWLEEMLMFAQRDDVGAVGSMLYYPDDTVQHAGVILGIGEASAGHSHRGYKRGDTGNLLRLVTAQNLSAVTGACMMIPRKVYEITGGLDESFRVALNDVDFCLRIRAMGYLIVFTPFSELYHYESKSRGSDNEGKNRERFQAEADHFRERWKEVLEKGDPYYNPNLTLRREDFSLRDEDEETEPFSADGRLSYT